MKDLRFSTARLYLAYVKPYRYQVMLGVAGLCVTNVIRLIAPAILRHTIDGLRAEVTYGKLVRYGALLVAIALVQGAVIFVQRRAIIKASFKIARDLRDQLYAHLQRLPVQFYHAHPTGDLMARMTNDVAAVRLVFGPTLISCLNTVLITLLIVPMMVRMNWRLALMVFAPLPLSALVAYVFSSRVRGRFQAVQQYFGTLSNMIQESLAGARVIKAYAQEDRQIDRFKEFNRTYVDRNLRLIRLASVYAPILQFFIGLSSIVVLWRGGNLIVNHTMTLGEVVQFNLYLGLIIGPIVSLGSMLAVFQRAGVSMGRLQALLSIRPAISSPEQAHGPSPIHGEIEFRDLTFSYEGADRPAINGVDLRVAPGQIVAFVGPVGSGKSTLLNLVPRLLDAEPGRVLIDGRPIDEIPLDLLRSAIGYVPEDTFLFSDSIADNIALGVDGAARAEIEQAARQAGIAEEIEQFPLGYETVVGERGVTLSGGQKQRVAIARALIRKPRILILDDALSSVDAGTEEEILKHLRRAMEGCTSLIASHRMSTIRHADLIVVLDNGRVVERGVHRELIAQGGLYASLYEKQMLEQQLSVMP